MTDVGGAHVAVVVQNVSLAEDNRLCKQVEALCSAGHRVSVITRRADANEPWRSHPGLTLIEYRAPVDGASTMGHVREYATSLWRQIPRLVRLHRRDRIDVLQICQPPDLYFPVTALARRLGVKVLLDQRDLMPEVFAQRYSSPPARALRVLHWLETRTQANVDASVTVNDHLRERLIAAGGAPERIHVVRNGPVLARLGRAREATPLPIASRVRSFSSVVTWAGKMGRQDRVDDVVRVAQLVVREWGRDDVGFMLIGNGECLDELRLMVDELGLGDNVWFPGWLGEVDLYRHLAAADVGIDTSLQPEVTPVKAMEYLGVGLPLVAYDVQETRRLAEGAGILVTPGDTETLAREVVGLLDDSTERARLGRVGSERIQLHLAWERQCEVYLDTVAGLIGERLQKVPTPRSSAAARPGRPSGT
ncbi:glycosyltransferase family 4 protein [Aeromicrobium ginsengisoli]|uniref:Glycosyltransferase family 4 protein n=1 Tax=Aeromicrobium ginsengisoli TaxID=363867 RepID=A0A5M4FEU1_9ACTN|nr:glycosyltransferase family 4 protein [Aeromicrobium ginsengisoli]KAA1397729.1 glycosyltransferase family 4 protein [Aeromicrobium ginsengisoli]